MTTTVSLRKILDPKVMELRAMSPASAVAGVNISSSRLYRQMQFLLAASTAWEYLPEEDAWAELPAHGLGGTFAAGACSICTAYSVGFLTTPNQIGAPLYATASGAGSTTTVVTVNNYGVNAMVKYQVRCIAGTAANIGQVRAVVSNTATTITTTAFSSATALGDQFTLEPITQVTAGAASTTTVLTAIGFVNGQAIGTVGNLVASSFITYQVRCTQTSQTTTANQGVVRWVTANSVNSVTLGVALPVAPATGDVFTIEPYNTVTASGAGTTTTVVTTNAWPINQFSGFQLRPLTGTAANLGQPRLILSNTATTLTLQAALPGATATSDTFVIEPVVFAQELTYTGKATTGGNATTIPVFGTPWVAGQWADSFQIRFTAGTNNGVIRLIANNTASGLTVATAMPATPDATSQFIIEPTCAYSPTTSIATNQTLARDLRGFRIRINTTGNVSVEKTIVANTIGRNAVITFEGGAIDGDITASNPSVTSAVASASGAGTTTTIVTTNSWQVNALVGYQVRCLSGTAGNINLKRTVLSNTATTLTLSVALPSATASADTFELNFSQEPVISSVTASGAGTTTTVVTTNTWAANQYASCFVRCVSGALENVGSVRKVLSNTATTLTLETPYPAATTTADVFEMLDVTGKPTTASGSGTTTTVVTGSTWAVNQYTGFQVRALSGTAGNIGCVRPVLSNTATTLTLAAAFPSATAASDVFVLEPVQNMYTTATYQLQTTRWYAWNAHTATPVAAQFRYYDYALNAWFSTAGFSAGAVGGIPPVGAAWGTDGKLVHTPSLVDHDHQVFDTFTTTSGSAYTAVCSNRAWAVNQWTNYRANIISGTGAGQVRTILANSLTTLSVGTWTVPPDDTSVIQIEGNDDNLYLLGNAAVTMYKFSISSGAWVTLAPLTARAAVTGAGMSAHWAWGTSEQIWTDPRNIVSGRRIYSMRGGASTALDYYDIPTNTWVSTLLYSPATTTFTTGSKYALVKGRYLYIMKEATGRFYRLDLVQLNMDPLMHMNYPQGAAVAGDTMFDVSYTDGATTITWIQLLLNTTTINMRFMLI